ncbi:hypothetical protein BS78_K146800 [Paspalum vaginatum]|uniref:Uncharacterized protein n=1 Tax=Paspalum vaginatum TaxID=158149 RepID=A0A9W7X6B7_9POAL|nr:hypothetical protein BS78_K146800 [Paspalum vaginatum]
MGQRPSAGVVRATYTIGVIQHNQQTPPKEVPTATSSPSTAAPFTPVSNVPLPILHRHCLDQAVAHQ